VQLRLQNIIAIDWSLGNIGMWIVPNENTYVYFSTKLLVKKIFQFLIFVIFCTIRMPINKSVFFAVSFMYYYYYYYYHNISSLKMIKVSALLTVFLSLILQSEYCHGSCLCSGAEIVGEYIWRESGDFGFEPNISCQKLDGKFTNAVACPDVGALREICCIDRSRPRYFCAQQVREKNLNNGYDELSIPSNSLSHEPVDVTVRLDYQTVTDIDISAGTIEIFVWLSLSWKDYRLAWTYEPNTTCTAFPVTARASMGSKSEIWVPNLDLFNKISGTREMGDSLASISNDGTVYWQRYGKLKAVCSMTNLGNMPFDHLGCQFMFG